MKYRPVSVRVPELDIDAGHERFQLGRLGLTETRLSESA